MGDRGARRVLNGSQLAMGDDASDSAEATLARLEEQKKLHKEARRRLSGNREFAHGALVCGLSSSITRLALSPLQRVKQMQQIMPVWALANTEVKGKGLGGTNCFSQCGDPLKNHFRRTWVSGHGHGGRPCRWDALNITSAFIGNQGISSLWRGGLTTFTGAFVVATIRVATVQLYLSYCDSEELPQKVVTGDVLHSYIPRAASTRTSDTLFLDTARKYSDNVTTLKEDSRMSKALVVPLAGASLGTIFCHCLDFGLTRVMADCGTRAVQHEKQSSRRLTKQISFRRVPCFFAGQTRQPMAKFNYDGVVNCLRRSARHEGARVWFKGLGISLAVTGGHIFFAYNLVNLQRCLSSCADSCEKRRGGTFAPVSCWSNIASGFSAAAGAHVAVYPLDTIRSQTNQNNSCFIRRVSLQKALYAGRV